MSLSCLHHLSLIGYCLMSNRVHQIVIPRRIASLALTLKNTHGRYAAYGTSGRSPPATSGRADIIFTHWIHRTYGQRCQSAHYSIARAVPRCLLGKKHSAAHIGFVAA